MTARKCKVRWMRTRGGAWYAVAVKGDVFEYTGDQRRKPTAADKARDHKVLCGGRR